MKKQMVKGLSELGILITLGAGILTGCTEKNVDYSIDGIREESQTEENNGKSGVVQFAGASKWNDMWEADDGTRVKIEADILLPKTEQMSVVEVEATEFNAEYKEQIARRLFGNGTVYYHDFEHWTKKELKERYDIFKETYDEDPESHPGLKEEMDLCEAAMENAKDGYTPADEYEMNEYIGKYNGTEYELYFTSHHPDDREKQYKGDCDNKWMTFRVRDNNAVCPKEYKEYTYYMEHPYADTEENECRLSKEELEQQAVKFVEKLGLEYPVLSYTKSLLWGDENMYYKNSLDGPVNGYVFHFEYGLDGVSISGYGGHGDYLTTAEFPESDELQYCTGAKLTVYVTEQGVIAMEAYSPVVTAGVTESVELLPLDTIKDIMKKRIMEQYEDFRFIPSSYRDGKDELVFTHMELIYFRVGDEENPGHYSYIPAWRLSEQSGKKEREGISISNPVIINAIDGSLIKLESIY